jgi:predicted RecA/RadA family phage recombinase
MNFYPLTKWISGEVTSISYATGGTAVSAGDPVAVGELLAFALADIPANSVAPMPGALVASGGLWAGAKAAGAWTAGNPVYWDTAATPNVTPSSSVSGAFTQTITATAEFVGIASITPNTLAAALSGDQYGYFVKVNQVSGEFASVVNAAGTNQATAAVLNPGFCLVSGATGSGANVSVALPANQGPSVTIKVKNSEVANAVLPVYPPLGGKINALATNAALEMPAKSACNFVSLTALQWFSEPKTPS